MSSIWQRQLLAHNHHGYYQTPANYYVSTNIFVPHTYNGQSWFDNIEDPSMWDLYATSMNYYNPPISGYIDEHDLSQLAQNHQAPANYYDHVSTDIGDHNYNQPTDELIDGVYVINESEFIDHHVSRNIGDHYLDHHIYNGQRLFDHIEDTYLWDNVSSTGEFIDGVYVTTESESVDNDHDTTEIEFVDDDYDTTESESVDHDDYNTIESESVDGDYDDTTESESDDDYDTTEDEFSDDDYDTTESESNDADTTYLTELLQLLEDNIIEEEEAIEETIGNMMKTRTHCGTYDDGGEICVICQCEYENDETIGTLECQHEYHVGCIKQWLSMGKISCPICRSSVLPS